MFIVFLAFCAGIVNGMFGTGGGVIALPMLYRYLHDERAAHSSVCVFVLPLAVLSAILSGQQAEMSVVLPICAGGVLGALAGCMLTDKFKIKHIKMIFAVMILYVGVRGLFV